VTCTFSPSASETKIKLRYLHLTVAVTIETTRHLHIQSDHSMLCLSPVTSELQAQLIFQHSSNSHRSLGHGIDSFNHKCTMRMMTLWLSVCPSAWKISAPNAWIFVKFDTYIFEITLRKVNFI
jgi:hypothetical protein